VVVLSIVANLLSFVKPFADPPAKAHGCSPFVRTLAMFALQLSSLRLVGEQG
jgi:hypothetical protein